MIYDGRVPKTSGTDLHFDTWPLDNLLLLVGNFNRLIQYG